MHIITLGGETSFAALADRLFANLTPEKRQMVETSLLDANPHLAGADAFKPGVVVRLPEVPGLKAKPSAAGMDPRRDLLEGLSKAVVDYHARLTSGLETESSEIKAQLKLLQQRKIADLLTDRPGAEELGKNLTDSLKQAANSLPKEKKRLEEVFKQIETDLASLVS